ncbi:Heavy metal-associated isoprenylated plant protein [Quillaja saponaria]|uniref:Heavy metal-associated isoprenylated plant protein n=1 Tax=Quillaja saponaria TaxID=32244 RepID=A0AAD7PYS1_QUISA|nr:Heavy metal-associated isoprenylated plant protein [Quillaja saponaria]
MGKGQNKQNAWQNQHSEEKKQDQENVKTKNEENKDEKNSNKSVGGAGKDIVLKVYMHCEGCSSKVSKCLRGFDGVEDVVVDRENHRVTAKGKTTDPLKVWKRLQKNYSRNVELISPKPKTDNKDKKQTEKKQEPPVKIVVLKMYIHCEGCATDIKKNIEKMEGVLSVEVNKENSRVTVRGVVDPPKLVQFVKKRMGKHAEIIKQAEQGDKGQTDNKKGSENLILFSYPPQYSTQYIYPSQTFSDENAFSCSIM